MDASVAGSPFPFRRHRGGASAAELAIPAGADHTLTVPEEVLALVFRHLDFRQKVTPSYIHLPRVKLASGRSAGLIRTRCAMHPSVA